MPANWKNGCDHKVILDKLSSIRTLNGENASFSGFEYDDYIVVLKSMIELDEGISSEVGRRLIVRGFHEAAKKTELNKSNVLAEINKAIREHNAKPDQSYRLITTININSNNKLPNFTINGCKVRFYKSLPSKYSEARYEAINSVSSWLIDKNESFSYFVIAHTLAKTEYDAANNMLDAIDLLRGIWNLHINRVTILSFGSGGKKPINHITLGALHTLHKDDGSKASDTYWYDPEHYKNHSKVDFSINSYKTFEFTKKVRGHLKTSSYKKEVESAIIRYVRALDSQNYDASFIKLWSVLEYLTSTLRDSYDKTIKRTVFHFADHEYHRLVLEHLRQYRNKSVHSGMGENDIDTNINQLKRYVELLLQFHIRNRFKFDSLSKAAEFMDLPPNIGALKNKISMCQSGLKLCQSGLKYLSG